MSFGPISALVPGFKPLGFKGVADIVGDGRLVFNNENLHGSWFHTGLKDLSWTLNTHILCLTRGKEGVSNSH